MDKTTLESDIGLAAEFLMEEEEKLKLVTKNVYVTVSIVLLIDLIFGSEPFNKRRAHENKEAVDGIQDVLLRVFQLQDKEEYFKRYKDFFNQVILRDISGLNQFKTTFFHHFFSL